MREDLRSHFPMARWHNLTPMQFPRRRKQFNILPRHLASLNPLTLCEVVQRAKPDPVWVKLPWLLEDLTPPEVAGLKPQACFPNDSPLLVVMRSMGKTTMGNHWMVSRPLPSCMSVDSISKPTRSQQRTSGGNCVEVLGQCLTQGSHLILFEAMQLEPHQRSYAPCLV